ncbi:MAG: TIGR00730 family Rossman fold protein [Bacteroidaceae bacterium]|nr:TIGR00730 family Rossman fold protein [Bacteroidaceae bacterium]MBP9637032.1 TIGR00730 family Rossman fold protein [Bacteroidaceae bacterium]
MKNICVYAASSTKIDAAYFQAAQELGTLIAQKKWNLVNGAGNMGLMAATSDAALAEAGHVIGVIPHFMIERGWQHIGLSELIEVNDMHERKKTMADLSDGTIALPGGIGTLEEILEIITWKQLGLFVKPIVILNINGFYDNLIQQLSHCIDEQFMRKLHGELWQVAKTPKQALTFIEQTPDWDLALSKFATI